MKETETRFYALRQLGEKLRAEKWQHSSVVNGDAGWDVVMPWRRSIRLNNTTVHVAREGSGAKLAQCHWYAPKLQCRVMRSATYKTYM